MLDLSRFVTQGETACSWTSIRSGVGPGRPDSDRRRPEHIALRLDAAAPGLLLLGVILFQYTRQNRLRGIGQTILSMGFVFLGISVIEGGISALDASPGSDLGLIIEIAERHPWILLLLATAMANALQSSTATIALMIGLGAAGTLTLPLGVTAVVGANLGIALTTLAVGWRQIESRRLAAANLIAKLIIAAAVMAALPAVVALLSHIPGGPEAQIALSHTAFNIATALLGLPLLGPIVTLVHRLIHPQTTEPTAFGPRHITQGHFDSPTLALGLSQKEVLRAGEIVRTMLGQVWAAIHTDDVDLVKQVREMDNRVDLLDVEVRRFLAQVMEFSDDVDDSAEQLRQLRYLNELETIGDIIDKNLAQLAIKKSRLQVNFTSESWAELDDFHRKVSENLLIAEIVFSTADRELAQSLLDNKAFIRDFERRLRDRRLRDRCVDELETGAILLDLLTHLKRINTHVTRIAYTTLLEEGDGLGV